MSLMIDFVKIGLGLSLALAIAELHGASIAILAGPGMTVEVSFPLADQG